MKIVCNKEEFARLVRKCESMQMSSQVCRGCVMVDFCDDNLLEDAVDIVVQGDDDD